MIPRVLKYSSSHTNFLYHCRQNVQGQRQIYWESYWGATPGCAYLYEERHWQACSLPETPWTGAGGFLPDTRAQQTLKYTMCSYLNKSHFDMFHTGTVMN